MVLLSRIAYLFIHFGILIYNILILNNIIHRHSSPPLPHITYYILQQQLARFTRERRININYYISVVYHHIYCGINTTTYIIMSTLLLGRYVKIHSLGSEKAKKHNGKTAIVKTPLNRDTGRYGIQPIDNEQVMLAIKPINFTILCSCCKMRDADESISCERCTKESYCSNSCKKKHTIISSGSDAVNNHEMWCVPVQPEMVLPTRAIGDANMGDDAYEKVCQYLQLSMRIGNNGRRNEERVMLEALVEVDPLQPSAYNNLFACCSELAALAERFRPEEYDELETKAIEYLIKGIEMLVDDEQLQEGVEENHKRSLEGPMQQVVEAYINTINTRGLSFLEGCMRGQRCMPGESHPKLERIEICLMAIVILLTQNETTSFKERQLLGYCQQKLGKYEEAVDTFEGVVKTTSTDDEEKKADGKKRKSTAAEYVDDKQWNHQSMLQIG